MMDVVLAVSWVATKVFWLVTMMVEPRAEQKAERSAYGPVAMRGLMLGPKGVAWMG